MTVEAQTILVTGGAGYVGSHVVIELLDSGLRPVILDDFSNSGTEVVEAIQQLSGVTVDVETGDVRNAEFIDDVFTRHAPTAVIHCAARKSVSESMSRPDLYMGTNVGGSLTLLERWLESDSECFVFSSSCTVYGIPEVLPVVEDTPEKPVSPYGWSKLMVDRMMTELTPLAAGRSLVSLRYFNPVGAHESGLIGENPLGVRTALMPLLLDVAMGVRPFLEVLGTDYPTHDGTAVRDYLHVVDVAEAHVAALDQLSGAPGNHILNLGRGSGISVLDFVRAFEQATGQTIPLRNSPRRAGDVPEIWCDPKAANEALRWTATRGLEQMCSDAWRYARTQLSGS